MFESHHTETPTYLNPLGPRASARRRPSASTPAVANAVIDALEPWGITPSGHAAHAGAGLASDPGRQRGSGGSRLDGVMGCLGDGVIG